MGCGVLTGKDPLTQILLHRRNLDGPQQAVPRSGKSKKNSVKGGGCCLFESARSLDEDRALQGNMRMTVRTSMMGRMRKRGGVRKRALLMMRRNGRW